MLFAVFISHALSAQTQIFKFEEGKSYCTIEIDTTLAVDMGAFRALEFMDVPYYEMTFRPEFEFTESGNKVLIIRPTWHYHAYLAKIYGEVEKANIKDVDFKLRFEIDPTGETLRYISTDAEKRLVYNRSSFSKKKHIKFVEFPPSMTKADRVDLDKYPKDLRKNLNKRVDKIRNRFN